MSFIFLVSIRFFMLSLNNFAVGLLSEYKDAEEFSVLLKTNETICERKRR